MEAVQPGTVQPLWKLQCPWLSGLHCFMEAALSLVKSLQLLLENNVELLHKSQVYIFDLHALSFICLNLWHLVVWHYMIKFHAGQVKSNNPQGSETTCFNSGFHGKSIFKICTVMWLIVMTIMKNSTIWNWCSPDSNFGTSDRYLGYR